MLKRDAKKRPESAVNPDVRTLRMMLESPKVRPSTSTPVGQLLIRLIRVVRSCRVALFYCPKFVASKETDDIIAQKHNMSASVFLVSLASILHESLRSRLNIYFTSEDVELGNVHRLSFPFPDSLADVSRRSAACHNQLQRGKPFDWSTPQWSQLAVALSAGLWVR